MLRIKVSEVFVKELLDRISFVKTTKVQTMHKQLISRREATILIELQIVEVVQNNSWSSLKQQQKQQARAIQFTTNFHGNKKRNNKNGTCCLPNYVTTGKYYN